MSKSFASYEFRSVVGQSLTQAVHHVSCWEDKPTPLRWKQTKGAAPDRGLSCGVRSDDPEQGQDKSSQQGK